MAGVGGACVAGGMHGRGAYIAGGHAWQVACMVGRGHACHGGMHGRGCAWQGACMAGGVHGRGVCMAGGHVWWEGVCMAGGHAWLWGACIPLADTTRYSQ